MLGSKTAFWLYIVFIFWGMVFFIYSSFKNDIDRQDLLLAEIRAAQQLSVDNGRRLQELEQSNAQLKESNDRLTANICILQEQIKSLGAVPNIESDISCTRIISTILRE